MTRSVRALIARQQAQVGAHPVLGLLEREKSIEPMMAAASRVTFWVMAFQDEPLQDPAVRDVLGYAIAATSNQIFDRFARLAECGSGDRLVYFTHYHLELEARREHLDRVALALSTVQRAQAFAVLDHSFGVLEAVLDNLHCELLVCHTARAWRTMHGRPTSSARSHLTS